MSKSPTKRSRVDAPSYDEIRERLNQVSTDYLPHDQFLADDDSDILPGYESDDTRSPEPDRPFPTGEPTPQFRLRRSTYVTTVETDDEGSDIGTFMSNFSYVLHLTSDQKFDPSSFSRSKPSHPLNMRSTNLPGRARMASMGWSLQDEDYNIFRPAHPNDMPERSRARIAAESANATDLPLSQAKLLDLILGEIILTWPPESKATKINRDLSLVNGHVFAVECVFPILDLWENVFINAGGSTDRRASKKLDYEGLRARLSYEPFKLHIWSVRKFELGLNSGRKHTTVLLGFVVSKEVKAMKNRFVVENPSLIDEGVAAKAFKRHECVLVDDSWVRICAPGPSSDEPENLILWGTDDPEDLTPTEEKIFGAVMFRGGVKSNVHSEYGHQVVKTAVKNIVDSVVQRNRMKRHMRQLGTMVKTSLGTTSTFSVTHEIPVPVPKEKPQMTVAYEAKIQRQKSLRVEVASATPVLQNRSFAYLEAFLPHYARQQMEVALDTGLINRFGSPDTAAFASYAYVAADHVDNDDSILRDESNFFWPEYKLILELDLDTHWTLRT
ncbi:hypothetical protein ONZ45_g6684 [Pleurotus djamor]|nr:hypothetical protein ONZ45_g6684 [Pleurotus djamor]